MTKNLKERIFTVVVGVAASMAAIFLFPHFHFLLFCTFMCIASLLGSIELCKMLFGKIEPVVFFAWLLPVTTYITIHFGLAEVVPDLILVFEFFCVFTSEIIVGEKDNFKSSLLRTAKNCLIIIYPSYFMTYLVKVAGLPEVNANIFALYFILVYGNDVSAYVFGMLFGRSNAGIIKVSPKKSLAGFAGSLFVTLTISLLLAKFTNSIFLRIVLGILMWFTANIGDLIESVFKRSADIKDSGHIFPGRGGMLDSMDSICAAGPIFYLLLRLSLELNI